MEKSKIIVAGPCAAESREQLFATAEAMHESILPSHFDFQYFRAGVWKPRTNPNDFQGVGSEALAWLKEIKNHFGFKICVEVANAEHVRLCLESSIDAVWIGARSTVNPFVVKEIADAMKNSNLSVFVKNPVSPDLNLWVGAINRFRNVDIKNIWAIHRGFSIESEYVFRNAPCWEIPMDLRLKMPDIPILCDIAHIAGNVDMQQDIAQTAIHYGFDGLMVEVHNAPKKALSDSKQQLTPEQLFLLLNNLLFPSSKNEADNLLLIQRNIIKNIDIQISKLLSKRMEVVDEIASIKAKQNLPVLQPDQWKRVVDIYKENALPDTNYLQFLEEYLLLLHKSSIKRQE